VMSITHVAAIPRRTEMNVVNQHPMLRLSGQILLAFCCATPLLFLLSFLV
jgi:hypothetical protein